MFRTVDRALNITEANPYNTNRLSAHFNICNVENEQEEKKVSFTRRVPALSTRSPRSSCVHPVLLACPSGVKWPVSRLNSQPDIDLQLVSSLR